MLYSIFFSAENWKWATLALVVACLVLASWSYWSGRGSVAVRLAAAGFKTTAFAALALCLMEPAQRTERPLPGANTLAILLDNSRSMQLRPSGSTTSRADQLRSLLDSNSPWQTRLEQDFAVKRYLFDQRMQAVQQLSQADFQGSYSMLAGCLETLQSRFSNQPMAGVLLFTDGIATDLVNQDIAGKLNFPIYPVISLDRSTFQDIAVVETSTNISSFEISPVTLDATIECRGMKGRSVVVRVFDASGNTLEKQRFISEENEFQKRLRFQFKPSQTGWHTVKVRALLEQEDRDEPQAESTVEVTSLNNARLVGIDRGGGPYRILYVAGRPNWEFKFLRRALDEDLEVRLHGLIRIAKKEPRFSFGDRSLGDVNPLIAGFSDNPDTAEQYDEPVLTRVGIEESGQLQAGFPSISDDLFQYHALILDDVESSFFTSQQMLLIRQFVAERGGAIMMLGGQESFLGGNYEGTPLGDLLPVYLRGSERSELRSSDVTYELSREGQLQPWLRLRGTQQEEQERFSQMPSFQVWNSVAGVKPGASTLASISVDNTRFPGLVTQRFGKGQSAALLIGDFWRWSMRRNADEKDDLAQTWRQMARWLTSDVPRRVELEVIQPQSPLDAHRLSVEVRDEDFKPMDNALVKAHITEPSGSTLELSLQPDGQSSGRYISDFWSHSDGGYNCRIDVKSQDGVELEPIESGWVAQPSAAELRRLLPDVDLLKQLAERSGGQLVEVDRLSSFINSLPNRKVPISETRIEPWWHRPWLVALAISCLCLEWGLRRWKGLP